MKQDASSESNSRYLALVAEIATVFTISNAEIATVFTNSNETNETSHSLHLICSSLVAGRTNKKPPQQRCKCRQHRQTRLSSLGPSSKHTTSRNHL